MTPQALALARTIPSEYHETILRLRQAGSTISEICLALEFEGAARMAAVAEFCLAKRGRRDLRGPGIGYLPGKTQSFRRQAAP